MTAGCDVCGARLEPEEYGMACSRCLRPRDEWEQEIKELRQQLDDEQHDLELIVSEVSMAYDAVTGGKLSKPNTAYHYVIEAVDEITDIRIAEAEEPLKDQIKDLAEANKVLYEALEEIEKGGPKGDANHARHCQDHRKLARAALAAVKVTP